MYVLNHPRYRTRKRKIFTNVLDFCDMKCDFVFVLAGWEGSAADSRILRNAISRPNGLQVLKGKWYLYFSGIKTKWFVYGVILNRLLLWYDFTIYATSGTPTWNDFLLHIEDKDTTCESGVKLEMHQWMRKSTSTSNIPRHGMLLNEHSVC